MTPHDATRRTLDSSLTPLVATDNAEMGNDLLIRRSRVRNPPGSLSYATAPAQGAGDSVGEAPPSAPTKAAGEAAGRGSRAARLATCCAICNAPDTVRALAGYRVCARWLARIAEIDDVGGVAREFATPTATSAVRGNPTRSGGLEHIGAIVHRVLGRLVEDGE
jgi:hypothetical protein